MTCSPDPADALVSLYLRVLGDQRQTLNLGLHDEQAIERIMVQ
jgi:hypothetical protein